MTAVLRAFAIVLAVLFAVGAALAAVGTWLIVRAVRVARLDAERAAAARQLAVADSVRAVADRDVLGGCGWCGHPGHDEHPARVHADEVAARIRAELTRAA